MKIQVTQKHIDNGIRGSCSSDPICLAMKDAGFYRPWVSPDRIVVMGFNGAVSKQEFKIPESVAYFMLDFDNGRNSWPFEFQLEGV